MFGPSPQTLVRTEQPLIVGIFGALMPPRFVRMPAKKAEYYVRIGHAVLAKESDVPEREQVVTYTEQDFARTPAVPAPREKPLDRAGVLKLFDWNDQQLDAAMALGFPSPDAVFFAIKPGDGGATRVPQWNRETVENWRAKIASLKVR